jgi:hypothetical protein
MSILALFRVVNRYVGNLPPITGVVPDDPASQCLPNFDQLFSATWIPQ